MNVAVRISLIAALLMPVGTRLIAFTPNAALAAPTRLLLADFERRPAVSIVGEGIQPKSRAAVVSDQAHSGTYAARVDYTFATVTQGLQYVGLHVGAKLVGQPTEFSVWVHGDGSGQPLRLRLTDATGETFQYGFPDLTWTGWREVSTSLARDQVHWSGNGDGKLDPPVAFDSVLVDSAKEPFSSTVYFDDLAYTTDASPVDQVEVALETEAFGGVSWGEAGTAPTVALRSLSPDLAVSGALSVRLESTRGTLPGLERREFSLEPGGETRVPLPWPPKDEGLYRAVTTVEVGGETRELIQSAAWFARPHEPGLDPASPFGACTHFGQGKGDVPRSFDLMSKAGIKWLRDEISWGACEQEKGKIVIPEWADRYMQAAVAHGVTPFIIFDYGNPHYDGGASPAGPEAQEAFGKYCFALVDHFKDICKHWEVYNEPNIGFWQPKPDPEAYARLLKIAYTQAKAADPTCTVVGVCTAGTDMRFIEEVLRRGGMDYMDALSIHPYRYPASPEGSDFLGELTRCHELMVQYGGGDKKLWLTEIGWPTQQDPRGVTEEVSGNYLVRMIVQALSLPYFERVIWYDFQDDGLDVKYNECNFGLIRWESFAAKQNYVAYKMLTEHLTGAKYVASLLPADKEDLRHCYQFEREGKPVLVAWSAKGAGTLSLKADATEAQLTWADAHRETRKLTDGGLTLALTEMPVFITGQFSAISQAEPVIRLQAPPEPLAPGEQATIRILEPKGLSPEFRLSEGFPVREAGAAEGDPDSFVLRITRDAKPTVGSLTVRITGAGGDEVASAAAALEVAQPFSITAGPPAPGNDGKLRFPVKLRNLRSLDLSRVGLTIEAAGGMSAEPDRCQTDLRSRATESLETALRVPATEPGVTHPLTLRATAPRGAEASANFAVGVWEVPRTKSAPVIDGDSSDWPDAPAAHLGATPDGFYVLREGARTGPEDQSATVRLMWSDEALYLLAKVTDDRHVQAHSEGEVWQSDNIQLAFDAGFAGWRATMDGKRSDYPEIGLTRTGAGDEAWRWLWQEGAAAAIAFRSSRAGNVTTYEAAVPWAELRAKRPAVDELAGFALLVNEDDGEGRDGWLELYSGIGFGKDPRRFGILQFVP